DRGRVGRVVEHVVPATAVDGAVDAGLVGQHEGVPTLAAGQVLDAGEGDPADKPRVDAGDRPGAVDVTPAERVDAAAAVGTERPSGRVEHAPKRSVALEPVVATSQVDPDGEFRRQGEHSPTQVGGKGGAVDAVRELVGWSRAQCQDVGDTVADEGHPPGYQARGDRQEGPLLQR